MMKLLEVELLEIWKKHDVKWLYKYKHRVKEYRGGNLSNLELFHDVTSGSLFSDIPDIANYSDVTADEVKVDIDELISSRRNQL